MKRLFSIAIGYDDKTEDYCAIVSSLTDAKHRIAGAKSMRTLMAQLSKMIRGKTKEVKLLPIREPERMIDWNGRRAPQLIIPARN